MTPSFPGFSPTSPCGATSRREPWERDAVNYCASVRVEQAYLASNVRALVLLSDFHVQFFWKIYKLKFDEIGQK